MTRLAKAVLLAVLIALAACSSGTVAPERRGRSPIPEDQTTAPSDTTTPAPTETIPPPVPPDPARFGCAVFGDGTIDCATQEAHRLFADEMNAYSRALALWEEQERSQNVPEPNLDDVYANDDGGYDEPYIDEPVDPYGFDEGPWP